jgi:hypothetical protein
MAHRQEMGRGNEIWKWERGATMNFRKIVTTILIAAMLFFAPSMIGPAVMRAKAAIPCGVPLTGLLPIDTAFAAPPIFLVRSSQRMGRLLHGSGPHSLARPRSSSPALLPTFATTGS